MVLVAVVPVVVDVVSLVVRVCVAVMVPGPRVEAFVKTGASVVAAIVVVTVVGAVDASASTAKPPAPGATTGRAPTAARGTAGCSGSTSAAPPPLPGAGAAPAGEGAGEGLCVGEGTVGTGATWGTMVACPRRALGSPGPSVVSIFMWQPLSVAARATAKAQASTSAGVLILTGKAKWLEDAVSSACSCSAHDQLMAPAPQRP
mmetsp:Transcript_8983/g.24988  ORF Transcript_8983/g.24988 Transcript_8983/m.24988 type:complete len:203 (-) Transcript_8983:9-617(-)